MCPGEGDRRKAGQGPMWAVVVVAVTPVFGHAANLGQAGEHVTVQHLGTIRAVEALDQCVLSRFPWTGQPFVDIRLP